MILLVSILLCLIVGCEKQEEIKVGESKEEMIERVLKEKNYVVVDVRTKEEYEDSHVKNALNIPYDEIDENTDLPKDKIIMVYCRSGKRSNIAYNTLKKLGYEVIDLGSFDSVILEKE